MFTLQDMIDFGADTETALVRCAGKEALYLRLVAKVPDSPDFQNLKDAIASKDYDTAFEYAHGLKGVLLNLSLTPIANPMAEMTELLRKRADVDYSSYLDQITEQHAKLSAICKS